MLQVLRKICGAEKIESFSEDEDRRKTGTHCASTLTSILSSLGESTTATAAAHEAAFTL